MRIRFCRFIVITLFLFSTQTCLLRAQITPGDINGDGKVDSTDITRGVQIALGKPPPATQNEIVAGDMNRDGRVSVQDLVFISKTIAGSNRPPVADASASPDSGLAGTDSQLDGTNSFDLDGDPLTYRWRQLHMNRFSTEYITENDVTLSDSSSATPTFNPEWPGNYRFEVTVNDTAGLSQKDTMDVLVLKEGVHQLNVKGINFGDIFGEYGGPQFNVLPDNPDSLAVVQSRAMDGAVRIGAEWVGIVPSAWYARINPLPEIRPGPNELGLTVESDYAAIVTAAQEKGLKVVHEEQVFFGILPLRPGELDSLEILASTSAAWWEQWFTEYKTYLLPRADWAQKYGVDLLVIYQGADFTFRPNIYPQYGERWREIITAVRSRYSGSIAVDIINAVDLNFADALDALQITIFPGLYLTSGRIADELNPTLAELRGFTEEMFDWIERDVGSTVPVYIVYIANSTDAQASTEPPPPPSELDFQEQVRYYEAFFSALEDETWVQGLFSERWVWFDTLDYPGIFFDAFTTNSPRNKPAEKAIELWFGIF